MAYKYIEDFKEVTKPSGTTPGKQVWAGVRIQRHGASDAINWRKPAYCEGTKDECIGDQDEYSTYASTGYEEKGTWKSGKSHKNTTIDRAESYVIQEKWEDWGNEAGIPQEWIDFAKGKANAVISREDLDKMIAADRLEEGAVDGLSSFINWAGIVKPDQLDEAKTFLPDVPTAEREELRPLFQPSETYIPGELDESTGEYITEGRWEPTNIEVTTSEGETFSGTKEAYIDQLSAAGKIKGEGLESSLREAIKPTGEFGEQEEFIQEMYVKPEAIAGDLSSALDLLTSKYEKESGLARKATGGDVKSILDEFLTQREGALPGVTAGLAEGIEGAKELRAKTGLRRDDDVMLSDFVESYMPEFEESLEGYRQKTGESYKGLAEELSGLYEEKQFGREAEIGEAQDLLSELTSPGSDYSLAMQELETGEKGLGIYDTFLDQLLGKGTASGDWATRFTDMFTTGAVGDAQYMPGLGSWL